MYERHHDSIPWLKLYEEPLPDDICLLDAHRFMMSMSEVIILEALGYNPSIKIHYTTPPFDRLFPTMTMGEFRQLELEGKATITLIINPPEGKDWRGRKVPTKPKELV